MRLLKTKEPQFIVGLRDKYDAIEHRIIHGRSKYMVNALNCHASPGTFETVLVELKNIIDEKSGSSLLNLGGGTGQVSTIIKELGFDIKNVDIEVEKETDENFFFDLNCDKDLPFEENSFDVVLCQEVIEHIENPWRLFRQVYRVLKPGGLMMVTTPNILSDYSKKIFNKNGYFYWFQPKNFDYHINPIPIWELELIAEKNNFESNGVLGSSQYYKDPEFNMTRADIIKKCESLISRFRKK